MENLTTIIMIVAAVAVIGTFIAPGALASLRSPPEEADKIRTLVDDGEAVVVDVRTPREFSHNGLDGALNLPLQQLSQRHRELGDKDKPLVLYCRSGSRSAQAKNLLEQMGYEEVYDLGSVGSAARVLEE